MGEIPVSGDVAADVMNQKQGRSRIAFRQGNQGGAAFPVHRQPAGEALDGRSLEQQAR